MNQKQKLIYNKLIFKYDFTELEKEQIELGLENNLDVSIYAKSYFNWMQMREVRIGLENNVDVTIYAKSTFNYFQMKEI